MDTFKVINGNKIESYYVICHNSNGKYQAVSLPWCRIDYRECDTKEDVFNLVNSVVAERNSKAEWVKLNIIEDEKWKKSELNLI